MKSRIQPSVTDKKNTKRENGGLPGSEMELSSFSFISSHNLQEPLRKIQTFSSRILESEEKNLSDNGKECLFRMNRAAQTMQTLINDLATYTRIATSEKEFESLPFGKILKKVMNDLKKTVLEKKAQIGYSGIQEIKVIPFQFYLLLHNLLSNSLKFCNPEKPLQIVLQCNIVKGIGVEGISVKKKYYHLHMSDNGIGFESKFNERIFEVFQRLNTKDDYDGTGIGLAICKKIVENHNGVITARGMVNAGACFDIYIPVKQNRIR